MTSLRVLIVDDSDADQFLSRHTLTNINRPIEVLQAYDGKEALELIASQPLPIDLIFLDINMPGMAGLEFLERFKSVQHCVRTKIIMLSSSLQPSDHDACLSHPNVAGFLAKPIEPDSLSHYIS
jgi:CheY-like chemotaxis protein